MSDKNSERLDAWIFFNDGKCDEDKQLFVDDIKDLKQKLQAAEKKVAELEQRELKLEAIVNAMHECYERVEEQIPFVNDHIHLANQIMVHLFNEAEIRSNINELVSLKVEMEDE